LVEEDEGDTETDFDDSEMTTTPVVNAAEAKEVREGERERGGQREREGKGERERERKEKGEISQSQIIFELVISFFRSATRFSLPTSNFALSAPTFGNVNARDTSGISIVKNDSIRQQA
jgi:hypothetical protein